MSKALNRFTEAFEELQNQFFKEVEETEVYDQKIRVRGQFRYFRYLADGKRPVEEDRLFKKCGWDILTIWGLSIQADCYQVQGHTEETIECLLSCVSLSFNMPKFMDDLDKLRNKRMRTSLANNLKKVRKDNKKSRRRIRQRHLMAQKIASTKTEAARIIANEESTDDKIVEHRNVMPDLLDYPKTTRKKMSQ
ncbi:hypothetical protein Pla144_40160 [Bythopirellula polymerisocia]|uniref:Uncharacterized protein n=2 Tax=Bythopirellula polymerisocia TaxID=2528003 RepID=A0A5C6CLX4_9BACT|nr:hypothetical protein Pla144_40160 [Bythopirellula polymerisocia]